MMPDLGKYADAVIWSYIASGGLLAGLVALSLWQGARVKRDLAQIEARAKGAGKVGGDE
jgi:heme exporter protein D